MARHHSKSRCVHNAVSNGINLSKYATPGASSFIPCAAARYELRRGTGVGVRERLWGDEASEGGDHTGAVGDTQT